MSQWQPIDTYDALKKKPKHAVFYFKAECDDRGRNRLIPIIELSRTYGYRTCTHWMPLPEPPKS